MVHHILIYPCVAITDCSSRDEEEKGEREEEERGLRGRGIMNYDLQNLFCKIHHSQIKILIIKMLETEHSLAEHIWGAGLGNAQLNGDELDISVNSVNMLQKIVKKC